MATETTKLTFVEGAAASTPAASRGVIYFKADGLPYSKDDAGVETGMSTGTAVTDATITTTDVTTNNAATTKHGWLKKLSNVATEYMDGTGAWSTPAGGGGALSTLGTTGMGASFQGARGTYFKKITLAATSCILSIVAGIKGDATDMAGVGAALFSDTAGSPINLISIGQAALVNDSSAYATQLTLNTTARLITFPVGAVLAAGDYHLAIKLFSGGDDNVLLAYAAGTGSDRTQASFTLWVDSSITASSSGTNDHTIYANILA